MLRGVYISAVLFLVQKVSGLASKEVLEGDSGEFARKYRLYTWVAKALGVRIRAGEGEEGSIVIPAVERQ